MSKSSTNVPQTFRYLIGMKQKTIEFFPEYVLSKDILSIWPRRADSGPNRNNLYSIREIRERYQNVSVSFPKLYRNVCPFVFDITGHSFAYVAHCVFLRDVWRRTQRAAVASRRYQLSHLPT
jgi:hypothetical protein